MPTCIKLEAMRKLFVILAFAGLSFSIVDVYTIQFQDVSGKTISMGSFKGKKVIVAVINAKSPDISYLRYLNQMQAKSTSYQIIAIPSTEFAGQSDPTRLNQVRTSEKLAIIVARPGELKKDAKGRQHPLLAWLTDKDQNRHFDQDIETTDKLFFINESGVLYAVLDNMVGAEAISNTLKLTVK
jgi:glutathione peroxidase-family protein